MPAVGGPGRAEERRANSALVGAGPAPSEGLGGAWATAASRPAGSVGRQGGAGGQKGGAVWGRGAEGGRVCVAAPHALHALGAYECAHAPALSHVHAHKAGVPAVRGPGRAEERRANSALVGAGPAPSEGLGGAWATAASRPAGSVGRQGGAGGQKGGAVWGRGAEGGRVCVAAPHPLHALGACECAHAPTLSHVHAQGAGVPAVRGPGRAEERRCRSMPHHTRPCCALRVR